MQSPNLKAEPMTGTCPKCGSNQIERGADFTPFIHGTAPDLPSHAEITAHGPEGTPAHRGGCVASYAANPPSIRCVNCDSHWDETEIDPSSERFAFLMAEHNKALPATAKET